jgi:Mechanosensitive ion channel
VLSSLREILKTHPKVEAGNLPVRFVGVGPYSLDVEVVAYVNTADYDEFLALQQELLLRMLQAVEKAGTALAVPLQEIAEPGRRSIFGYGSRRGLEMNLLQASTSPSFGWRPSLPEHSTSAGCVAANDNDVRLPVYS